MAKTVVKSIRLSEHELRKLKKAADAEGLYVLEYIRLKVAKGLSHNTELIEFIVNLTDEINRIGKKINIITIHSNQGIMMESEKKMLFEYLREINSKIEEAINHSEKIIL